MTKDNADLMPSEIIEKKIYLIRGQKVMLDRDLSVLYAIETKQLKRQVNRNIERFPEDFMFILNDQETRNLRCQFGTSSWGGERYQIYAFTEQGVAMLSSVLNSRQAIQVNIQIMRTFTKIKKFLMNYKDLQLKIEKLESKYDNNFKNVFEAIRLLIQNDEDINKRITYEDEKIKKKKYGFQSR